MRSLGSWRKSGKEKSILLPVWQRYDNKTGVYKQTIQCNFNYFKDIYYQSCAFMKFKKTVHMYSQHIARIQWSE